MDNTWIKSYRKAQNNEIWNDKNAWRVFQWILWNVDYKTGIGKFTRQQIAMGTGLNESTVYKSNSRLTTKYQAINIKSNNHFTEISVRNWARYQQGDEKVTGLSNEKEQDTVMKSNNDSIYIKNKEIKNKEEREIKECQKSLTPCNDVCLWEIGMKLDTHMKNVAEKSQDLLDYIEDHPKKYKTFHKTLINWVKGDLRRGYVSYLSETERLEMKMDHPDKIAERKKIHDQAVKEGII